jgi:hypothetical protein
MKEFIKLVECYSKGKLSSLFPPQYKSLVCCLQLTPGFTINEDDETKSNNDFNVLELLIKTFKEDKFSGVVFVSCFPVWFPPLVKYYSQKYDKNFFTDFYF